MIDRAVLNDPPSSPHLSQVIAVIPEAPQNPAVNLRRRLLQNAVVQRRPVRRHSAERRLVRRRPVRRHPAERRPVRRHPIEQSPVEQSPVRRRLRRVIIQLSSSNSS